MKETKLVEEVTIICDVCECVIDGYRTKCKICGKDLCEHCYVSIFGHHVCLDCYETVRHYDEEYNKLYDEREKTLDECANRLHDYIENL